MPPQEQQCHLKNRLCDRGGIIGSLSNGEGDVNKNGIKEIGLDW